MNIQQKLVSHRSKDHTNKFLVAGAVIVLIQFIFHFSVWASPTTQTMLTTPDSIKHQIEKQLADPEVLQQLNFPNTVKRFYVLNAAEANWLRPDQNIGPTASAMLLLDCVRQFGLQRENYHPAILNYSIMHDVLNSKKLSTATQKTAFEIMLTDAMISMIYHLHYGAFNPNLSKHTIDKGVKEALLAEQLLLTIKNSTDLKDSILAVQPKMEQYVLLQGYMKLIAGQYVCDSYETPEADVKAIAYNMERLRWNELKGKSYIHINVPSFQLLYQTPDTSYLFKVVVGKAITPTPTMLSSIRYLETAPKKYFLKQRAGCDNTLGKVAFRFDNSFDIYLHDAPEQSDFNKTKRALSHGSIRIQSTHKLAILVLQNDLQQHKVKEIKNAMSAYKKQIFELKLSLPILITYLTTTVEDGLLVKHEDIYHLDTALSEIMFGQPSELNKVAIK